MYEVKYLNTFVYSYLLSINFWFTAFAYFFFFCVEELFPT